MSFAAFAVAAVLAVVADPATLEAEESTQATQAAPAASEPAEPSTFQKWWKGEEAIYDTGLHLSLGALFADYNGGKFKATPVDGDDIESANVAGVSGIRADLATTGSHFGFLVLGLAYYTAGEDTRLQLGDTGARASLTGFDVRLIHPRLRYALRRFEASASFGPVLHLGWAKIEDSGLDARPIPSALKTAAESSAFASVGLEAGAGLRFYPLNFLFVEGGYSYSFSLFNAIGEIEGMNGFRVLAGLAF